MLKHYINTVMGVVLAGVLSVGAASAATDLSGVTLVLGDQAGGLRALAEAAKVLEGTPYKIRWANFQGAAPLFEAQRAGAVDLAPAGDLPVLAAAVGDPELRIVAARVGDGTSLGIVVPKHSTVKSLSELKGQGVVVSSARGSISQYQLYGALAEKNIAKTDVPVRFVLPVDASAAFDSGQINAWATFDPYYAVAVQHGARVLRDGVGINSGLGFLTSPAKTLADPAKRGALADVLQRLSKAGEWAAKHQEAYAKVYSSLTRLPIEVSRTIVKRAAVSVQPVTDQNISTLQKVADKAAQDGILRQAPDVKALTVKDSFRL